MPHSLSSEHLSATSVTLPSPQMIQQAERRAAGGNKARAPQTLVSKRFREDWGKHPAQKQVLMNPLTIPFSLL